LTALLALLSLAIAAIKSWTGSYLRVAGDLLDRVRRMSRSSVPCGRLMDRDGIGFPLLLLQEVTPAAVEVQGRGDGDRNATASNFDRLQNGLRNRTATSGG
jgi:hypothetical protein